MGNVSVLYNVTFNLNDLNDILVPCVPYSVAEGCGEDSCTKRVCLSDSIERCLTAIGSSFRDIHAGAELLVRSVDVNRLDRSKLISYDQLYSSGKVPDAMETHEYWYLDTIHVILQLCRIDGFCYEHVINWTCLKADDVRSIISKYVDINAVYGDTALSAYNSASEILNDLKMYEAYDSMYDEIALLPWAQGFKICDLKLTVLKTLN